jgi:hypothetical protein
LLNWNGTIIGTTGDIPPSVITSKPAVTPHGNKSQLDSFAEGPPAIHHINFLSREKDLLRGSAIA